MDNPLLPVIIPNKTERTNFVIVKHKTKKTYLGQDPQRIDVYHTYVIWKSLPFAMKKGGKDFVLDKMGVEDDTLLELSEIKTQTEFSEKYGIHIDTLTEWNKRIKKNDELENVRTWLMPMLRNVMLAAYNVALKADPKANADRRFIMEYAGWIQEIGVTHKVEGLAEILKEELKAKRLKEKNAGNNSITN